MTLTGALKPGVEAARKNVRPSLFIFGLAILVLVGYYRIPAVRDTAALWRPFRSQYGLWTTSLLTVFASMVVPFVARLVTRLGHGYRGWADFAFRLVFFALIGPIVDLWYSVLAGWLGTGTDVVTVAAKVFTDQLVLSPLVTIPYSTVAFWWRDCNFSFLEMRKSEVGFFPRYASLLVGCWVFWFPMLITVFLMPSDLQFCMFVFLQAAWSLVLVS